jgi:glycosyltransferase involved in cell wall biosynthesis
VRFTGFLDRAGVDALLARAAAVVMPSISEPFGLVALEAAAAGVPVVVSHQSGVGEVLRHGLRVDFWRTDDLAEKILALVRRPALREALTEGAADEARRLSWERSGLVLLGAYREVLP